MPSAPSPLEDLLARRTREGELYEKLPQGRVRCFACGHRCVIPPGRDGICRVRFNDAGVLRVDAIHQDVPFDRTMTAAVDGESKDLAHWLELDLSLPG